MNLWITHICIQEYPRKYHMALHHMTYAYDNHMHTHKRNPLDSQKSPQLYCYSHGMEVLVKIHTSLLLRLVPGFHCDEDASARSLQ